MCFLSVSKGDAKRLLQRQIDNIAQLGTKPHYPPEFEPWRQQTHRIVKRIFGEHSDHAKQFDSISFGLPIFTDSTPDSAWEEAYQKGLTNAEVTMKSFIDELDLFDQSPALACPKCGATEANYLEIDTVGSKKYNLAIPQVAGVEWKTGKKVAYFMCNKCQCVFYTEPFKQG